MEPPPGFEPGTSSLPWIGSTATYIIDRFNTCLTLLFVKVPSVYASILAQPTKKVNTFMAKLCGIFGIEPLNQSLLREHTS